MYLVQYASALLYSMPPHVSMDSAGPFMWQAAGGGFPHPLYPGIPPAAPLIHPSAGGIVSAPQVYVIPVGGW